MQGPDMELTGAMQEVAREQSLHSETPKAFCQTLRGVTAKVDGSETPFRRFARNGSRPAKHPRLRRTTA
jgi:hypothetical protein